MPTSQTDPLQDLRSGGGLLIASGVISLLAGVLALAYPGITLLALAVLAGVNLIALSVLSLGDAFAKDAEESARVLAGVVGILGLIAGLVVLRRPGETLLALVLVLGIWMIVNGAADVARAMATLERRAVRLFGAIVDIALGILVLSLPGLSLSTLAVLIGIAFAVRGGTAVVLGWHMRGAAGSGAPLAASEGAHAVL